MDKNLENDIPTFSIEELAGILRGSEETGKKPIFFIGAGFSISGGIPCAEGIKEDVKKKIRDLGSVASSEYPDLMKKLTIEDRRKLFKGYMENSWVNPAHMYLAELYDEYVDFILTTNFDDLILQSLAIRNVFPPTYDMPLIHKEDLGTTEFEIGSVFYLHGQRYGLHHLHTQEEMLRVKDVVESVLRSIVAGRPWIVVGYSGRDPIFECMCN